MKWIQRKVVKLYIRAEIDKMWQSEARSDGEEKRNLSKN